MLKLTKRADYGMIALRHLAVRASTGTATAREIAEAYHIPPPLLAKVLQRLTRAGMLQSVPGTNGGYRLARDPHSITALEVIGALDGPVRLTTCLPARGACDQAPNCTVREPLYRIHQSIIDLLGGITISEMSADKGQLVALQL